MFNLWKKIILFALFISLASCADMQKVQQNFIKKVEENEYALILMGCKLRVKESHNAYINVQKTGPGLVTCNTEWRLSKINTFSSYQTFAPILSENEYYPTACLITSGCDRAKGATLVKPNTYTLTRCESINSFYQYYIPDLHKIVKIKFTAKGGEVLYLGDIVFEEDRIKIENNYNEAALYVKKVYPELYHKLQIRLLTLPNN